MEYMVLTSEEQLLALTPFLRDAEAAHYRLAMLPSNDPTRAARLEEAERELKEKQAEYKALQTKIAKENK